MAIEFIYTDGAAAAPVAARSGDMVLVGGLMPIDSNGKVVGSTARQQAEFVYQRLRDILTRSGAGLADVVKTNLFFTAPADDTRSAAIVADVDAVRAGHFDEPLPVTTELRCKLERTDILLMIDAWAIVGGEREIIAPPGHWSWGNTRRYPQGIKVGNRIFVGAQRPFDGAGKLLGIADIEAQTDRAFGALDRVLVAAGGSRNNLMRQNTFFSYTGEGEAVTAFWEKMTAVRRRYMSSPSAAGAGLRVFGPGRAGELINVEGIAVLGDEKLRLQPADHWDWSIAGNTFTQGWLIQGMGFIGGQISADSNAKAVGETLEQQARNVFRFVRRTLAEGDMDERHVAKLYIYYSDAGEASPEAAREVVRRVQDEFYGTPGPTVTAIRVEGFAFENLLIEIEAIAFK